MKKVLGRGTAYIMIAEALFIVTSYAMHLILGRRLGPGLYGTFGVVIYIATTIRAFLLTGIPRAVAKYTSENNSLGNVIKREALKIQAIFSLAIFSLYFSLSGIIAKLLNDPSLAIYLRMSAFIIPLAGITAVFTYSFSGLRKFKLQAVLKGIYYIARAGIVVALVYLGYALKGAVLGLVLANLIILLIASYLGRFNSAEGSFPALKLIKFAVPIIFFSCSMVLLMSLDLLFVKAMIAEKAVAGFYTSAKTFARVPYYLFSALSITLLPSVSRSIAANDSALTKKYINQALRYMLLFLAPITCIISTTASDLIKISYSVRYIEAGVPLSILIFGFLFFSVFMVLSTIITASGRPKISMSFALLMIPVNILLNIILISRYQMLGAAVATSITFLFGLSIAAVYVYKKFRTLVSVHSVFNIFVAAAIVFIISVGFPVSGIALLGKYIALFVLYFLLLFMLKEIGKEDVDVARNIILGRANKM